MIVAPEEHARPARQLQRQSLEIAFPRRLGQTEALQLEFDGRNRIIRQSVDARHGIIHGNQRPAWIKRSNAPPCGVKTARTFRVVPGREALIKVGGHMPLQIGAHHFENIFTG